MPGGLAAGGPTEHYLSAYVAPPGPDAFLSLRHNHCIALWARRPDSIELVRYWELERVSGIKHHAIPLFSETDLRDLLDELLSEEGLQLSDVSAIWGTSGLDGFESFPSGFEASVAPLHGLAHLWSVFLMDTDLFRSETIVGLAMDAGPDFDLEIGTVGDFYPGGVSRRGSIELRPIASPAVLFKAARQVVGLEPGSLMAAAGASAASIGVDCDRLVEELFPHLTGAGQWAPAFGLVQDLADRARAELGALPDGGDARFTREENVASAVGEVLQEISESVAIRNVGALLDEFEVAPSDAYLALSGGYALNCPTNSLLMRRFGFKGLLAAPCANDGGQALGLGLLAFHHRGDLATRSFRFSTPFHGRERLGVDEALADWRPWIEDVSEFDPGVFVDDVMADPVAWVDGAAEIGPRALGHRSILGDPRTDGAKDRLNELKRRQWWRPVAPIVLEDEVAAWFVDGRPSPYMLEVFEVSPERLGSVPAVVHLDGTARVQTIARDVDPRLCEAIGAFAARTGVPMLCNTSLNDKGEPIVDTAAEALNFCVRRGVRVAYLGGRRVALRQAADRPAPEGPEPRARARFEDQKPAEDAAWEFWSPYEVGSDVLFAIGRSPELRRMLRGNGGPAHVVDALRTNPELAEGQLAGAASNGRRSFRFDGTGFVDEAPAE
ncbi:MAG: carbamoyltransferase C-terminal domain-containing protein [Gaiellaceae bacterium]